MGRRCAYLLRRPVYRPFVTGEAGSGHHGKRRRRALNTYDNELFFALTPVAAWVASGCIKYAVNRLRYGAEARSHIGNGGFPSTHTAVISSAAALAGFEAGFGSPMFGLAVAVTMIVVIDATGVRRAVGEAAVRINALSAAGQPRPHSIAADETGTGLSRSLGDEPRGRPLREKQGHTKGEVLGGLAVGTLVAWFASLWL